MIHWNPKPMCCRLACGCSFHARNVCFFEFSLVASLCYVNIFFSLHAQGGLQYTVVEAGRGPKPKIGDLVAIRFSVGMLTKFLTTGCLLNVAGKCHDLYDFYACEHKSIWWWARKAPESFEELEVHMVARGLHEEPRISFPRCCMCTWQCTYHLEISCA